VSAILLAKNCTVKLSPGDIVRDGMRIGILTKLKQKPESTGREVDVPMIAPF
jgi:hypothetical protein